MRASRGSNSFVRASVANRLYRCCTEIEKDSKGPSAAEAMNLVQCR